MPFTFPKTPPFTGFSEPFRAEVDILDLEVEGHIPEDINGHFYRVQPDFIYPPKCENDVPFNGDGHVSLFKFENGHASLKSRYVKTQRYKAQTQAKKALFGTYRNPRTDDPSVEGLSAGTANTNLVFHHNKLFALKEDSLPVELDPMSLETIDDAYDFQGAIHSKTFTAHPKIDPVNGQMLSFGYQAKGEATTDIAFYTIDKNGKVVHEAWAKAPYAGMIHDFAITQSHIALLLVPMIVSVENMEKGGVHFAWDSSMPSWLGVMERHDDGSNMRWFKGPACCATHVINAYSEGSRLILDMDMAEGNQFPFFPGIHEDWDFNRALGNLTRISIDLDSDQEEYDIEALSKDVVLLPRIDERYWSLPYNTCFLPSADLSKPRGESMKSALGFPTNCWTRYDHDQSKVSAYYAGPQYILQECQFVAKPGSQKEGQGYLIGLANNFDTMQTEVHIVDSENLSQGRIAKIKLPLRLRNGVHGIWVDADKLNNN